jgi:hypothetical protein
VTLEQRRQAIDFGKIRGTGMPVPPIGLLTVSQRAHVVNVYYESPAPPAPFFFWRNRNLVSSSWAPKVTPQDGSTQVI